MGTDNYTKEEREFYESILQEIRSHQDFGKRNPVDIGIECGYSEDDVMGMIYMCQDIVGEKQTQQEPIPVRENWDLEGIIPFEDFVKIDFPKSVNPINDEISYKMTNVCYALKIDICYIEAAMKIGNKLKKSSLKDLGENYYADNYKIGFTGMTKWMSLYGIVAANVFEGKEIPMLPFIEDEVNKIKELINLEIEVGEFHPINKMVIEANGWDKKLEIQ